MGIALSEIVGLWSLTKVKCREMRECDVSLSVLLRGILRAQNARDVSFTFTFVPFSAEWVDSLELSPWLLVTLFLIPAFSVLVFRITVSSGKGVWFFPTIDVFFPISVCFFLISIFSFHHLLCSLFISIYPSSFSLLPPPPVSLSSLLLHPRISSSLLPSQQRPQAPCLTLTYPQRKEVLTLNCGYLPQT